MAALGFGEILKKDEIVLSYTHVCVVVLGDTLVTKPNSLRKDVQLIEQLMGR